MSRKNIAVLSVAAQEDNLGDIEIRERLFSCISSTGIEIIGFKGLSSSSYMEAFLKYERCTWFSKAFSMQLKFIKCLFKGYRLHFFMAPGPSGFSSQPKAVVRSFANLINMILAKLSGGTVHIVGRAYRGQGISRVIEIAAIKIADTVAVRDELSNLAIGGRGKTLPDLAFSGTRYLGLQRKYIAISVREDEGLFPESFDSLIAGIREFGAIPILVTQVRRDNGLMKKIALRSGIEFLQWDDDISHSVQRDRIEEIYRMSSVIVSNRLHGLIMGLMAGATPIPLINFGNTKLLPTMKVVLPNIDCIEISSFSVTKIDDWKIRFDRAVSDRDAVTKLVNDASRVSSNNFSNLIKSLDLC